MDGSVGVLMERTKRTLKEERTMSNDKTKDYGLKDMINDFVNPAEYKKTSDLANMGNLRVVGLAFTKSDDYGDAYVTTLKDVDDKQYLTYVSAKQPFGVFNHFKDAMIGSIIRFETFEKDNKKTILKVRLVTPSDALFEALNKPIEE